MTKSKETGEFGKFIYLGSLANGLSITQETSLYEDRFSFIRRHFLSSKEEDDFIELPEHLLELKTNDHNLRSLNFPVEEKDFKFELDEDLFEQLYCSSIKKNRNKRTDLNYRQTFVVNHFEFNDNINPEFSSGLSFLQKVVFSTNEENLGKLILSLLNVLSIWFDLAVFDLYPFFSLFHGHLLVPLYLHLPVFLNGKAIQFLLFACKWLKRIKGPLYELLKPQKKNPQTTRRS